MKTNIDSSKQFQYEYQTKQWNLIHPFGWCYPHHTIHVQWNWVLNDNVVAQMKLYLEWWEDLNWFLKCQKYKWCGKESC